MPCKGGERVGGRGREQGLTGRNGGMDGWMTGRVENGVLECQSLDRKVSWEDGRDGWLHEGGEVVVIDTVSQCM